MDVNNNNEYSTKDLAEAGMLIVNKQPLLRIDRKTNICWFVFNTKNICEELSNQFFFGEILVNAREYYEAINRLKNRIFARY